MGTPVKKISMGFTKEKYPPGTHMCLIFNDENERKKVISKFLLSGINAGEKVAYFTDEPNPLHIIGWMTKYGLNLLENEPFDILLAKDVYCPKGYFSPKEMIRTLKNFYKVSQKGGYSAARVSGEMSWALKGISGSEQLIEYEALVNKVLLTHPITAICQYDANQFDGATILNILKVHPLMIVYGKIIQNPYYMKPHQFLTQYRKNNGY